MSEDWSKPLDVDPLADGQADIDFAIALAELPRLSPQLAGTAGSARGRVHFARQSGLPVADVAVTAQVTLRCQRCLEPMQWPIEAHERVAMIAEAAQADQVPEELETILARDRRIRIRDLVEEELLLSLPIAPLHALRDCGAAPAEPDPGMRHDVDEGRQRPFERLGELLKRDKP